MNVVLEAYCLSKICASVGSLNVISVKQVNNLVCIIKKQKHECINHIMQQIQ